jgi:two-component system, NarL family, sensor histidine kinase UhpB
MCRRWVYPVNNIPHPIWKWFQNWHLSLFEKVILVNSIMLIAEAFTGLWVTSHQLESHHYLIDTIFIVSAALFTLFANILLLHASFRPLFHLLATIRDVSTGNIQARATFSTSSWEVGELAQAFNSMLDRLEITRREQTMLILQAQEDERRRIGMELHDEAGQNLTALLIQAEILNQRFQSISTSHQFEHARTQLTNELQQLTQLTQLTLENIRVLAQQLRPSVLDDLGLLAAFRWLVEDSRQRLHLHVHLDVKAMEQVVPLLPPNYETALFRIAQESLTNVARHAHASMVTISLSYQQQHIYLRIEDNGTGYTSKEPKNSSSGILGMHERVNSLGGTLHISSQAEQGTTVLATLPLPHSCHSNDAQYINIT